MDENIRTNLMTNFFFIMIIILAVTTIAQLTIMLTIVFGNISGKEFLVGASIVASTFFGAFGTFRMLSNISKLIEDMSDEMSKTNYGVETQNVPVHILRFVFPLVILIVGIIQFSYVL